MSIQRSSTAPHGPLHHPRGDQTGSSDDSVDAAAAAAAATATDDGNGQGGYLEHELWDAFEIDDDDPQPEYGDFWYEEESIE